MSKAVLISIRPTWCEKIAGGEKVIEVRKTRPKMDTPFKCYIYCTVEMAGYDALWVLDTPTREKYSLVAVAAYLENPEGANKGNGKVIGEFTCEDIYEIDPTKTIGAGFAEDSCVSSRDIHEYLGGQTGYGWHISELKIYDRPKELIEFHTWKKCKSCSKSGYESTACIYDENCMIPAAITKAPQNWCYVEEQK